MTRVVIPKESIGKVDLLLGQAHGLVRASFVPPAASVMSLVAVASGVNNHILTAQSSPHLTPRGSPSHSQLRRA
jgi:hypothetical protein